MNKDKKMADIQSTYDHEKCHEDFGLSSSRLEKWVRDTLANPDVPLVAVTKVSPREANSLEIGLNNMKYELWYGKYMGGTGKYKFLLRKAGVPEHKHPFFRDCNYVLTVERAA